MSAESSPAPAAKPKTSSLVILRDETRPCHGLRVDLKRCLLETDCCVVERKTPLSCLREGKVPTECMALSNAFYECKRGLLDMRSRFRGRKGY
ncbi:hypothetical protein TCAL_01852 [Tigriopus californicus]|uniref:Cytochrome c oxidase assembly factor 5 n=1 Tax=Tigriopus californicus TaxID=6832 RepID=A0A553ND20_TIGCA|nr:hypothetical protein TCAL_01852 [Tigriopus californicus]|eukprot:TCALIF_01852-PA protein Name:"Similar to coa5 Cytochrome c oxidase assembly factor 5 (Xenopus tropicalis)" AED:0.35 eAED:0.49 QI:0/-1/0/1/-1/1/1/0/92